MRKQVAILFNIENQVTTLDFHIVKFLVDCCRSTPFEADGQAPLKIQLFPFGHNVSLSQPKGNVNNFFMFLVTF